MMTTNLKLVSALALGAALQLATAYELAAVVRHDNVRGDGDAQAGEPR
ncbi:MAG: hypothetical protein JWM93_1909 [Frankiales bacterium]|nr:hypothetical protein [Frankiales bacterium]